MLAAKVALQTEPVFHKKKQQEKLEKLLIFKDIAPFTNILY
jgi:hypothetical protein